MSVKGLQGPKPAAGLTHSSKWVGSNYFNAGTVEQLGHIWLITLHKECGCNYLTIPWWLNHVSKSDISALKPRTEFHTCMSVLFVDSKYIALILKRWPGHGDIYIHMMYTQSVSAWRRKWNRNHAYDISKCIFVMTIVISFVPTHGHW